MNKQCISRLITTKPFSRTVSTYDPIKRISLKPPSIDIKRIKAFPQLYQDSITRRGISLPDNITIEQLLKDLDHVNSLKKSKAHLTHVRNVLQKQLTGDKSDEILKRLADLKTEIKDIDITVKKERLRLDSCLTAIPNLTDSHCPDTEPEIVDMIHGDKKRPANDEYDHMEIASFLGIVDFKNASNVSGTSSYYFIEDGALLEQALIQFALSRARKAGWSIRSPPSLVRQEYTFACGFRPRDTGNEQQVYLIEDSDLCLTGTAEIPLAGYSANQTFENLTQQPIRHVGVSRSFRAEAGSRGRDTKGLYRVHEFTKVELFAWTATEHEANDMLEEILEFQKSLISDLGLCSRVLNMPCNDLGNPAYKKYDIEAWMPGRGDWGEISSASNCLDYQSRRLHTKYKIPKSNDTSYAQTLNGTAMAIPRIILALIENYYDPISQRMEIPSILRPFMDNRRYIEKAS